MLDSLVQWIKESINSLKPWVIINVFERGVAITCGRWTRVLEPGLHFIVPLKFTDVFVDNVVWRTTDLGYQSGVTKDGRTISFRAAVTSRIRNIEKAILEVESVDDALKDACSGALGGYVATHTWEELLSDKAPEELAKACQKRATRYGHEIDLVQFMDLTPSRTIRLLQDGGDENDAKMVKL